MPHPRSAAPGNKSKSRPQPPPLTVAARARAKHAHRCRRSSDPDHSSFFGTVAGGTAVQNEAADAVVARLLSSAAWINCHAFGRGGGGGGEGGGGEGPVEAAATKTTTVFEVRAVSGYGARWSADWTTTTTSSTATGGADGDDEAMAVARPPVNVRFRGFLEPQMEDGHERGWRH